MRLEIPRLIFKLLVTLNLTISCYCHYIHQRTNELTGNVNVNVNEVSREEKKIQICGPELTTLMYGLCEGVGFNLLSAGGGESDEKGIVDYCCRRACTKSFMRQFCAVSSTSASESESLTIKAGTLFSSSTEAPTLRPSSKLASGRTNDIRGHPNEVNSGKSPESSKSRSKMMSALSSKDGNLKKSENPNAEVRVRKKKRNGRKHHKKRQKKGRNLNSNRKGKKLKMECVYKSFAHYLLKRDPDVKVRSRSRKRKRNGMLHPLVIVTIAPDYEKIGGQPVIVPGNKNKAST